MHNDILLAVDLSVDIEYLHVNISVAVISFDYEEVASRYHTGNCIH